MFTRLLSRKTDSRTSPVRSLTRTARSRRLLLESLEDRRMLALDDFGAIQGTLFYNLLPENTQQPIAGQPVRLYQDANGNNTFDPATDTLVDTQTTNAQGVFRFESLKAATYFIQQPPEPSGNIIPAPTPIVRTIVVTPQDAGGVPGLVIDNYADPQALNAQLPATPSNSNSIAASGAVGGFRLVNLEATLGIGLVRVDVDAGNDDQLKYSEESSTTGNALIVYDGQSGANRPVNPTGLGGIDLTGGGSQNAFLLEVASNDIPSIQKVTVYTDANRVSTFDLPLGQSVFDVFQVGKFSSFSSLPGKLPADFSNVGAITLDIRKQPGFDRFGLDYELRDFSTVGPRVLNTTLPYEVVSEINIVKFTNGTDNNSPTGPVVPEGSTVTWTYRVTNPGNETLRNVVVRDDAGTPGNPADDIVLTTPTSGDTNSNGLLEPTETWIFTASGIAQSGQYSNTARTTGVGTVSSKTLTDNDIDHYFGYRAAIEIEKATNGQDADTPRGPIVPVGSTVTWTYEVRATGNVPLRPVVVVDDNGTPNNSSDDFSPRFVGGDTNNNGALDLAEIWRYEATGTAQAGQYGNIAVATGTPVSPTLQPIPGATNVTDSDPSHYFGFVGQINVEKATNGQDADTPTGPLVPIGSTVTWSYVVTNPGTAPLRPVRILDDNGTPANPNDDFSPVFTGGDVNNNGALDPNETWTYTAQGVAQAGQYANIVTVTGTPNTPDLQPIPGVPDVTDTDPSHYFGYRAQIDLEKATNGQDADTPTGPLIPVTATVTWTYVVTNPGNVPLRPVSIVDDNGTPTNPSDDFTLTTPISGDTNNNGALDVGETWTFRATGIAREGQYGNVAVVTGTPLSPTYQPIPNAPNVTDTDPSHYFGYRAAINIEKATNGQDADTPTGPLVAVGSTVTWTYVVTNPGNVPLRPVTVVDDNGTPSNAADNFSPTFEGGDTNNNGALDVGESWRYRATGTARAGQYGNIALTTGTPVSPSLQPIPNAANVTDTDPSHYFGYRGQINIEKATNGQDADNPTGPLVAVGSTVTWTYNVTNPGNVPLRPVVVVDDNGTPTNPNDDFQPRFVGGDTNNNGALDTTETWRYEFNGTAQAGQYRNVAVATGTPVSPDLQPIPGVTPVNDNDPSHYFGVRAEIQIVKLTNGTDNNTPPGRPLQVGSEVVWTYNVSNPGNVPLRNIVVTDDKLSVNPQPVLANGFNTGDTNRNSLLDPGETWVYEARGTVIEGPYTNMGTVTGTDNTNTVPPVRDEDPDNYIGIKKPPILVLGPDKAPGTPQSVRVVNSETGAVLSSFVAYESTYTGGTRVALADINADGTDEIITAPGRNRRPEVKFFTLEGASVPSFTTFLGNDANFDGGIQLGVADVNNDGKPDIITVPSYGPANVRVFYNRFPASPAFNSTPDKSFLAFPTASIGGAVVAAGDMGRLSPSGLFINSPDGIPEIVVATAGGTKTTVSVFDVSGANAVRVKTFNPFTAINSNFTGGASLEVANIDADSIPDIIVGMGVNGNSRIEVWSWTTSSATLGLLGAIPNAFTGPSNNAPVNVATLDRNGDGIAEQIFATQGPIGTVAEVHRFQVNSTTPFSFTQLTPLTGFPGPYFIATSDSMPTGVIKQFDSLQADPATLWTNPVNPFDVNDDGYDTPRDALLVVNHLLANPANSNLPLAQYAVPRYLDTDGNRMLTPFDLLYLINYLNKGNATFGGGAGEGEGEGTTFETTAARSLVWTGLVPDSDAVIWGSPTALEPLVAANNQPPVLETKWYLPDAEVAPRRATELWQDELLDSSQRELEEILNQIVTDLART